MVGKSPGEDRFKVNPRCDLYVCPKCGEQCEAPKMWVPIAMTCDECGSDMERVE